MFMKSGSLDIHASLVSQDCVAASRKSAAFSARKGSGALTRHRYSGLAILAAGEQCELALLPFENSEMDVPKGQMTIAQRFNAGIYAVPEQVPKGRLKDGANRCTFSRLRDSNPSDVFPGVETPGYCRKVPPGQWFAIRSGNFRKAFRLVTPHRIGNRCSAKLKHAFLVSR